jgi:23S rRNA pseudouridine955/2504/2580 synthase
MDKVDKPAVQWVEISSDQAGQRIDNFLHRFLKGVPKSRIYRLLRKGEVRVNRARARPEYRVRSGDQVRIPPVRMSPAREVDPGVRATARVRDAILYEDDRLLVLNKPSGMAVHGGSGLSFGVIEALRALRPGAPFLELVHRLDRDTSGCLLIAKRRSELRTLHGLLRVGQVDKRYLLLVKGNWTAERREVEAPLRKNLLRGGERMVRVDAEGKQAVTRFGLLEHYRGASLLEARLETGRTHQIRVHAAHVGHPLAGDDKYGDGGFNRDMRGLGLKRLFLHAHYIAFRDPERDRSIEVSAPLDPDLRHVIQHLELLPDTGQSSQTGR